MPPSGAHAWTGLPASVRSQSFVEFSDHAHFRTAFKGTKWPGQGRGYLANVCGRRRRRHLSLGHLYQWLATLLRMIFARFLTPL